MELAIFITIFISTLAILSKASKFYTKLSRKPRVRYSDGKFAHKVLIKGMEKGYFYL